MCLYIYIHHIFRHRRMNDLVVVLQDVWLSIVAQHLTFRVSAFVIPKSLSFDFMFELLLERKYLSMYLTGFL